MSSTMNEDRNNIENVETTFWNLNVALQLQVILNANVAHYSLNKKTLLENSGSLEGVGITLLWM